MAEEKGLNVRSFVSRTHAGATGAPGQGHKYWQGRLSTPKPGYAPPAPALPQMVISWVVSALAVFSVPARLEFRSTGSA